MNIRNIFLLIAVFVAGSYLAGCTEEDGPVGPGDDTTTYAKPSNLQVTSISATEIKARWQRGAGDVGVDTLIATPVGGGAEMKVVTAKSASDTSATLSGLSVGTQYDITVAAHGTNGRTAAIRWATATRSGVITLYETADNTAGHNSGLVLGANNETSSTAHSASTIGAEKLDIDLVLATDNSLTLPFLSLQGADVTGSGIPGGRVTRLGNNYFIVAGGLDFDFYAASIASEFTLGVNFFPVLGAVSNPIILLVKTADNHYARVEIVPQSSGFLWKDVVVGSNSYRAIDVIVSYQPTTGVAYAGRPVDIARGFNTPRTGGAKAVIKN